MHPNLKVEGGIPKLSDFNPRARTDFRLKVIGRWCGARTLRYRNSKLIPGPCQTEM